LRCGDISVEWAFRSPVQRVRKAFQREVAIGVCTPPGVLYRGTSLIRNRHLYRATSPTRNRTPLGPYRRPMPRVTRGS